MSGQIAVLPQTLPPGLYEQAGGRGTPAVVAHATGSSISALTPSLTGSFPSPLTAQTTGGPGARARPLQPQATGQDYSRLSMAFPPSQFAASPVAALGANAFGGTTQQQWDVTPEEKAQADITDLRCLYLCIAVLERINVVRILQICHFVTWPLSGTTEF